MTEAEIAESVREIAICIERLSPGTVLASGRELEPAPLLEPAPCDGCSRAPRCAVEHLACSAFAAFLDGRPWQAAPRVDASRERYRELLGDDA